VFEMGRAYVYSVYIATVCIVCCLISSNAENKGHILRSSCVEYACLCGE
jgi:hypothetical protein